MVLNMDIHKIEDNFFVSGQITTAIVDELAAAGFKTIICNRPDNEDLNQINFHDIEDAAKKHEIAFFHIPVTPPSLDFETVEAMKNAINLATGPILAYCRSGTRSKQLYLMAQQL